MKPTINLTIKGKWFNMIAWGDKREEYRDCENKQVQHEYLAATNGGAEYFRTPHVAVFRNGYTMESRAMAVEVVGYDLRGRGSVRHIEWGEPTCRRLHLVVKLGRVLQVSRYAALKEWLENQTPQTIFTPQTISGNDAEK